MGERFAPTYHINSAEEIHSLGRISHHDPRTKTRRETLDWLPSGPVTVGVTAGASTPNRTVGEVISRVLEVRGIDLRDKPARPLPLA